MQIQDYLDQVERSIIEQALQQTRYNRTQAAKLLGISFRSMRYRMERLGHQLKRLDGLSFQGRLKHGHHVQDLF